MDVDLHRGVVEGRTCLTNLPGMARQEFLLNRGMSVKSVRDGAGTLLHYRGPLHWFFFGESVPEYLGLKMIERFQGDSAYRERLRGFATRVGGNSTLRPPHRIATGPEINERYRYEYGPLLLVGLEQVVGQPAMRRLLHALLTTRAAQWDYAALRQTALDIGVPAGHWERFERECVHPPPSGSCVTQWRR